MDEHVTGRAEEREVADVRDAAPRLSVRREGAVAVVEFANPPLNLLTMDLRSRIRAAAADIAADGDVRAVVLQSEGDRSFSAGSDIREFPPDQEAGAERAVLEHACYDAVAALPQPVVAAVQGHVLGGGLELAMAADLRVADESARFGLPEVKLGVFPSGAGTQRLPRLVHPSRAKRMMYLGEVIEAGEALELGLVDEVAPSGTVRDAALRLAQEIAAQPRLAVQAIKKAVDHGLAHGHHAGQAMEVQLISHLFASHDAQEGVRSFLESRVPVFQHR
jgi:enoyl-CoA hydratase